MLLTQLKNYCKSRSRFRFGTCLSFMNLLIIFKQTNSPLKLDLKNFDQFKFACMKSESKPRFIRFPTQCVSMNYPASAKKVCRNPKKTDKKSDQDFHIDWFDTEELIACA